jgi:hypothetical protein
MKRRHRRHKKKSTAKIVKNPFATYMYRMRSCKNNKLVYFIMYVEEEYMYVCLEINF